MRKFCIVFFVACLSFCTSSRGYGQKDIYESTRRTWKDISGLFVLPGELVELSPTQVRLQSEDGFEFQVDRSKLSQADQQYLVAVEESRNPFREFREYSPEISSDQAQARVRENATHSNRQTSISVTSALRWSGFKGPPAERLTLGSDKRLYSPYLPLRPFRWQSLPKQSISVGVASFPPLTYDPIAGYGAVAMFRVDPNSATVMLNLRQTMNSRTRPGYSAILVGDLPAGPFRVVVESETEFTVLDHNERTGHSLVAIANGNAPDQRELVVFDHLTDQRIEVIGRYRLPASASTDEERSFSAKLLDDNKMLISDQQGVSCWDVPSGKFLYLAPHDRSTNPEAVFTQDRSVWTMNDKNGVHFIHSASGKSLGYLKLRDTAVFFRVVFSASGEQVALVAHDSITILETTTGKSATKELNAKQINQWPFVWEHPRLMINRQGLVVDTLLGTQVAKYRLQATDSVLWDGTMSFVMTHPTLQVQTLPFPATPLLQTLDTLAENNELIAVPGGSEISFDFAYPKSILTEEEYEKVQQLVRSRIEAAGWKIVPKSSMGFRLTIEDPQEALEVAAAQNGKTLPHDESARPQPYTQHTGPSNMSSYVSRLAFFKNDDYLWAFSMRYYIPVRSTRDGARAYVETNDHIHNLSQLKVPKQIFNPSLTIRMKEHVPALNGWREEDSSTVNLDFFDSQ